MQKCLMIKPILQRLYMMSWFSKCKGITCNFDFYRKHAGTEIGNEYIKILSFLVSSHLPKTHW